MAEKLPGLYKQRNKQQEIKYATGGREMTIRKQPWASESIPDPGSSNPKYG
jgi:hypothetical protein